MIKPTFSPKKLLSIGFYLAILYGLYLSSLNSYLLFHTIVELITIVVGCGIFIIAWNTEQFSDHSFHLFLGIAFLFISIFDFIHTIAYSGMNILQGYDANLPTQLWIAARFMQSVSLLLAFSFLRRKINEKYILTGYILVTSALFISIHLSIFPTCYIEGVGLTLFKRISEYVISLILMAGIVLLHENRKEFKQKVYNWLLISLILSILSEISFTFYVSVFGLSNFIGHIAKLIAFLMIYKAIIEKGMMQPFDSLFKGLAESHEHQLQLNQQLKESNSILYTEIGEREKYQSEMEKICTQDSLTGLYNRRFFDKELARLERGRSYPISIIMIDVDDLKETNDMFGHAAGDTLLKNIAKVLLATFRSDEILARIGGDEFGVLLPNTNPEEANGALQRAKLQIKNYNLEHKLENPISISTGFDTAEKGMSLTDTLKKADENMYREKYRKK